MTPYKDLTEIQKRAVSIALGREGVERARRVELELPEGEIYLSAYSKGLQLICFAGWAILMSRTGGYRYVWSIPAKEFLRDQRNAAFNAALDRAIGRIKDEISDIDESKISAVIRLGIIRSTDRDPYTPREPNWATSHRESGGGSNV